VTQLSGELLGTLGVELCHHCLDEGGVILNTGELKAASQVQLLHQATFEVAMRGLN